VNARPFQSWIVATFPRRGRFRTSVPCSAAMSQSGGEAVDQRGAGEGLGQEANGPASSAWARTLSSGKAVMKMNGTRSPLPRMIAIRCGPLITGICTSAITHDVSFS
jgi:hypothetical protein